MWTDIRTGITYGQLKRNPYGGYVELIGTTDMKWRQFTNRTFLQYFIDADAYLKYVRSK